MKLILISYFEQKFYTICSGGARLFVYSICWALELLDRCPKQNCYLLNTWSFTVRNSIVLWEVEVVKISSQNSV